MSDQSSPYLVGAFLIGCFLLAFTLRFVIKPMRNGSTHNDEPESGSRNNADWGTDAEARGYEAMDRQDEWNWRMRLADEKLEKQWREEHPKD